MNNDEEEFKELMSQCDADDINCLIDNFSSTPVYENLFILLHPPHKIE